MRKILFSVNVLLLLACVYVVSPKAANYIDTPWSGKAEESGVKQEQTNDMRISESNTEDGTANGLIKDVISDLFKRLPGNYEPEVTYIGYESQEQMIEALKQKQVDLVFPVGESFHMPKKTVIKAVRLSFLQRLTWFMQEIMMQKM